ncbi:MAG: hypothetical protein ACFFEY_14025 [Candidatus Thorarchaeota archaeon]
MTEIKKLTKIALIVDAIIWFIFGLMMLFLFDLTLNYEGWTNPLHVRAFGVIAFVAFFFVIIMLLKKEWEEIKLLYICLISMCIGVFIVEAVVLGVLGSTFMAVTVTQMILDLILNGGKDVLSIVAYIKQRK